MKIINQSADELVLKEGDLSGIAFGVLFVIIGAIVAYYIHASNSAPLWIGLGAVVIGLGMVFFSSSITVDLRKTDGQIAYQTKRLIGGSNASYAIADVLRIETRKQWRMENSAGSPNNGVRTMGREKLVSQSVIVFKDGRELPLDHQKQSSGLSVGPAVLMGGIGKEVAIANQVATFLGVPFQEIAPPTGSININIGGGNSGN